LPFNLKTEKNIENHEMNENEMLKSQNVHEKNLYKMTIFNCFKNKQYIFFFVLTFLPKLH